MPKPPSPPRPLRRGRAMSNNTDPVSRAGIATAMNIGRELCQALGLDSQRVVGLQLTLNAGQPVQVVVTRYISETQGLAIVELLTQRFTLVESALPTVEPIKPADQQQEAE